MKNLKLFEEFNMSSPFKWIKDMKLYKIMIEAYNVIKNVFDGENYDEVCHILNEKFGTDIEPNNLKLLAEKISRNNNKLVNEKRSVLGTIIALVLAFCVMYPIYKVSKNMYVDNKEYIQDLERDGYKNVKFLDYEMIGPMVMSPRGTGLGVGVYKGEKDGKTYIIWAKAMGKEDVIVIDTKIKKN